MIFQLSYSSLTYLLTLEVPRRPSSPLVEGGLRLGHGLGPRPEELGVVGLVLRLAQVLVRRALERLEQPDEVRVDLGRVELQPEGELDLVAVRRLGLGLGRWVGATAPAPARVTTGAWVRARARARARATTRAGAGARFGLRLGLGWVWGSG